MQFKAPPFMDYVSVFAAMLYAIRQSALNGSTPIVLTEGWKENAIIEIEQFFDERDLV